MQLNLKYFLFSFCFLLGCSVGKINSAANQQSPMGGMGAGGIGDGGAGSDSLGGTDREGCDPLEALSAPEQLILMRDGDLYFLHWSYNGDVDEEGLTGFRVYSFANQDADITEGVTHDIGVETHEAQIEPSEVSPVFIQVASISCANTLALSPKFRIEKSEGVVALIQSSEGLRIENFVSDHFSQLILGENEMIRPSEENPIGLSTLRSPDGNWLAVEGDLTVAEKREIWLINLRNSSYPWRKITMGLEQGDPRGSLQRRFGAPQWRISLDSRWLAFSSDFEVKDKFELWIVDIHSEMMIPQKISAAEHNASEVTDIQFSPDSYWVAFKGDFIADSRGELWVQNLNNLQLQPLKISNPNNPNENGDSLDVQQVRFSSNSRWIGFSQPETVRQKDELWLVDLNEANLVPVKVTTTSDPENQFLRLFGNQDFLFSPDNRWVVVAGPLEIPRKTEVWLIDLNLPLGTSFQKVSISDPNEETHELSAQPPFMEFSANVRFLVMKGSFDRGTGQEDLFLFDLVAYAEDVQNPENAWIRVSPFTAVRGGNVLGFEISPDNLTLVFEANFQQGILSTSDLFLVDLAEPPQMNMGLSEIQDRVILQTMAAEGQGTDISTFNFLNQKPLVYAIGTLNNPGKFDLFLVNSNQPEMSWKNVSSTVENDNQGNNTYNAVFSPDENWIVVEGDLETADKNELWLGVVDNYLAENFSISKVSISAEPNNPELDVVFSSVQFSKDSNWLLYRGDLNEDETYDACVFRFDNPENTRTNLTQAQEGTVIESWFREDFQLFSLNP